MNNFVEPPTIQDVLSELYRFQLELAIFWIRPVSHVKPTDGIDSIFAKFIRCGDLQASFRIVWSHIRQHNARCNQVRLTPLGILAPPYYKKLV